MTIGEKTLHAILDCDTRGQFSRLCWIASFIDKDFPALFSSYVNAFVAWKENEIDDERYKKYSYIVINSVNAHVKWGFWSLLFRLAVRIRKKS